jgi:hypothetical protein
MSETATEARFAVDIVSVLALASVSLHEWAGFDDYDPTSKSLRLLNIDPVRRSNPIDAILRFPEDVYFIFVENLGGIGAVGQSNRQVFLEAYECPGVHTVRCDNGDCDIAIRLEAITQEMVETIVALEDCSILDESVWSDFEAEARDNSWDSWVRWNFERDLCSRLSTDDIAVEVEGELQPLFEQLREQAGEQWEYNEQDNSCSINISAIVKIATIDRLLDYRGIDATLDDGMVTFTFPEVEG